MLVPDDLAKICWLGSKVSKSRNVVRPTSFSGGANGASLPATKWLALNNRTSDGSIHIEVSSLNASNPVIDFNRVKRVQACG